MSESFQADNTLFVTGTDTGVGKTLVSAAMIRSFRSRGVDAVGFKPVASGSRKRDGMLRNSDATALQKAAGGIPDYDRINPYCFAPAIAPHLAATEANQEVSVSRLDRAHAWLSRRHSLVVAEGAGGWYTPLNRKANLGDWVAQHGWPVVLVVGMRLGCLNHAMLSAQVVGTSLAGWIANCLPPVMPRLEGNLESLHRLMPVPCWGVIPPGASVRDVSNILKDVSWPASPDSIPNR